MKKIEIKEDSEVVQLELQFGKLLATQNEALDSRVTRTKLGFQKEQMTERKEGTPETELSDAKTKKPTSKRVRGQKREDTRSLLCHCFPRVNNGDSGQHVFSELGGPWGHIKRTLNRGADAMNIALYKRPALGLIRFEPEIVDLGAVGENDVSYTDVLEPRSRGKTRELTLYETVTNRTVKINMLISQTCPLTGEEISALLTALRDYDGFGPSSRGKITSIKVLS